MADAKSEIDSDAEQNYSLNSNVDPKNMQELTIYVSSGRVVECAFAKQLLIS